MNKKLTSFALLGLITAGSCSNTQCISPKDICNKIKKPFLIAASVVLGAGIYRLFIKTPTKNPQSKFDKEALKNAIASKNFKEIKNQLWYFFDDIFVGQVYKGSSVKVKKQGTGENAKLGLQVYETCPPTGVLGNIHGRLVPFAKAIGFILTLRKFLEVTTDGLDAWKDFLELDA